MSYISKTTKKKTNIISRILGLKDEDKKGKHKSAKAYVSDPGRMQKNNSANLLKKTKKPTSAPAKILTKKKVRPTESSSMLMSLPNDIKSHILDKLKDILPYGYKLRKWIPSEYLNWRSLCENPYAIEMIEERLAFDKDLSPEEYKVLYLDNNNIRFIQPGQYNTVHWGSLSINKNAILLIERKMKEEEVLTLQNYELLRENDRLNWVSIGLNPNPIAMNLLNMKRSTICWPLLCSQKNAMDLFILPKYNEEKFIDSNILFYKTHKRYKLDWKILSSNPAAIHIIKEHLRFEDTLPFDTFVNLNVSDKVNWSNLAKNSNPAVIPIIKKFIEDYIEYEHIVDENLNPFLRYTFELGGLLHNLWENPRATKYLLDNFSYRIKWEPFSANTSKEAIQYLRQRIEIEKGLDLNHPDNYNKISWSNLSSNPSAFDLLNENQDKIHWGKLCCNINPKVMKLIEKKFREDPKRDNYSFRLSQNLDWQALSQNPAIFIKKGAND